MRRHSLTVIGLLIVAGTLFLVPAAGIAQDATPVADTAAVVSPEAEVGGLSLGEWLARQWQWWISFPAAINPGNDVTGASCGLGQSGPVFFLAGINPNLSPDYPCSVPEGVMILVPLGGAECSTAEPPPFFGRNETELRECAVTATNTVAIEETHMVVDGVDAGDLSRFRVTSPLFTLTLPEGNVFGAPASSALSVADGYQAMVGPMTAGSHTIAITFPGPDGTPVTVTYQLTVVAPQIIEPAASPEAEATPRA